MKKILAIIAAAVLAGGMLMGCEEESSSSGSSSKEESSSVVDSSSQDDSSQADSKQDSNSSSSVPDSSSSDIIVTDDPEPVPPTPESSAPESSIPDSSEPDTEDGRFDKMLKNIKSSRCMTIKASESANFSYYMVTDGNSMYMQVDTDGKTLEMLKNSEGSYILDSANKKYYADSTSSFAPSSEDISELINEITEDVNDFKFVSSGTKTVDGVTYESEKYTDASDPDDSYEILFDENGSVCYVISEGETIPMQLSDKADFDFSLPSDYTKMTEAELGALFGFDDDMDFVPEDDDDFDD